MDPQQRVARAASLELARHLAGAWQAGQPPGVAETALGLPDRHLPEATISPAIKELAEALVSALLGLAQQEPALEPAELAGQLRQAGRQYLAARPELPQALAARVAAEVPGLLNLPRLTRLAANGLQVSPVLSAAGQDEPLLVSGRSAAFKQVLDDLAQVARTDFPVLLCGESGTGKELLARRLHSLSGRQEGPFVALNCAALAPGLLESELFGHEKGAFTGAATASPGHIRQAHQGTLFLDEIGQTSPEFQLRLLRVLEEREVTPVGGVAGRAVDFRLVCATHRDLDRAAAAGQFNQALLYRIMVVPLNLPPLRQRREDLPLLIDYFLDQACRLAGRACRLAPEVRQALLGHDWPGNVRQLSHMMQRLVALARDEVIGPELLPPELAGGPLGPGAEQFLERLKGVAGIPAKRAPALAALLAQAQAQGQELANRDLRQGLGCSDSTAKNILRALSQAGLVQAQGSRGGRRYAVLEPQARGLDR